MLIALDSIELGGELSLRHSQVVGCLEIHPESRTAPEEPGEPERRGRGHGTLAAEELGHVDRRQAGSLRQAVGTHPPRFEKVFPNHVPGVDRGQQVGGLGRMFPGVWSNGSL